MPDIPNTQDTPAPKNTRTRSFVPPPRPQRLAWSLVAIATALVLVLSFVIFKLVLVEPAPRTPTLSEEFRNNRDRFGIRPPVGWPVQDRIPNTSLVIKGPRELGFSPLIIVLLDIAPGKLASYAAEHKARLQTQEKTVKWTSEQEDALDGCRAMRLEYECDYQSDENQPTVRLKTLQYLIDDHPRFYRITCHATAETYARYLPYFELSARSFRRMALN